MQFTSSIVPKNGGVDWELRVILPALMTPDRQVAKGHASNGAQAKKAIAAARVEYEKRFVKENS